MGPLSARPPRPRGPARRGASTLRPGARARSAAGALALAGAALVACAGKAPPGTTAAGAPAAVVDPSAELTPEACADAGGQIKGDIGDGQVACDPGDRQLGRVRLGVEGSICCAPARR